MAGFAGQQVRSATSTSTADAQAILAQTGQYSSSNGVVKTPAAVTAAAGVAPASTTTSTAETPANNNYSYVDNTGKTQMVQAPDPATALKSASNIGTNSGVQLVTAPDSAIATPNNPDAPSSSSTYNSTSNANGAVISATQPTPPSQNSQSSAAMASIMGKYGVSVDSSDIESLISGGMSPSDAADFVSGLATAKSQMDTAKQEETDQDNYEQATYDADLANENAEYGAQSVQLAGDRQNAISTATQGLAAANVSGGQNSDAGQYMSHINQQYDMAQAQLTMMGQQAKAQLDAGNAQAYATINANMANVRQQVSTNIQNLLSGISNNETQQAEFAQQQTDTDQAKAATAAQAELATITGTTGAALTALPTTTASMTPAQLSTLNGAPGYQQLIKAGYTPDQALGMVQAAATGNKQQNAENAQNEKDSHDQAMAAVAASNAQANMMNAQANVADKESLTLDLGTIGSAPNGTALSSAFTEASAGKTAATVKQSASDLADATQAGPNTAKQTLQDYVLSGLPATDRATVSGLQTIGNLVDTVKADIAALPANQQTGFVSGNIQNLATKFGQNPSPALQKIAAELNHIKGLYISNVFGKRAVLNNSGFLSGLIPNTADGSSLAMTDLDGLKQTATDYTKGVMTTIIDPDTYNSIYGSGSGSSSSITKGATATFGGNTYTYTGSGSTADISNWTKQ